jgi:hypothetical protein
MKQVETNLRRIYAMAMEEEKAIGLNWYPSAWEQCKIIAGRQEVNPVKVAGVVAALSPGMEWGRNLVVAEDLIKLWKAGKEIPSSLSVYGYGAIRKAKRILEGELPTDVMQTAKKTKSFFLNMIGWEEQVTIDRHAKAAAYWLIGPKGGSDNNLSKVGKKEYDELVGEYRGVARQLGLEPAQLQAIVWVTWKRISKETWIERNSSTSK